MLIRYVSLYDIQDLVNLLSYLSEGPKWSDLSDERRNVIKSKFLYNASSQNYYCWGIFADHQMVGTTTLIVDESMLHGGSLVGRIENVAVDPEYRHQKIGQRLIKTAIDKAEHLGCYKTILCCSPELEQFYKKNDFENHGLEMRKNNVEY